MASADAIRDGQRAAWAGLSSSWEKWDAVIMDQLEPVGAAVVERLDVAEDQQHLDIASGTGERGLASRDAARRGASCAQRRPPGRSTCTNSAVAFMFRCAAPGQVAGLFEAAGLRDVAEWDVGVELVTRSPAEYWAMISEHASLPAAALRQVDEPARERIRAAAIANVSAFAADGEVRVPGVARCIVGTKPD